MAESDPIPLDGDADLTASERLALRKLIREQERLTWARKQLRWIAVSIASAVAAGWALISWVRDHVVFR